MAHFFADIVIMKPKSDLCTIFQKNYNTLNFVGRLKRRKLIFLCKCQEHVRRVDIERAAYKSLITSKFEMKKKTQERKDSGKYIPNSYDGDIHYSLTLASKYTFLLTHFNLGQYTFLLH